VQSKTPFRTVLSCPARCGEDFISRLGLLSKSRFTGKKPAQSYFLLSGRELYRIDIKFLRQFFSSPYSRVNTQAGALSLVASRLL
jgi:hypothetical protein